MDVKYSSDGAYLGACDSNKKVLYYSVPDYTVSVKTLIGFIQFCLFIICDATCQNQTLLAI